MCPLLQGSCDEPSWHLFILSFQSPFAKVYINPVGFFILQSPRSSGHLYHTDFSHLGTQEILGQAYSQIFVYILDTLNCTVFKTAFPSSVLRVCRIRAYLVPWETLLFFPEAGGDWGFLCKRSYPLWTMSTPFFFISPLNLSLFLGWLVFWDLQNHVDGKWGAPPGPLLGLTGNLLRLHSGQKALAH